MIITNHLTNRSSQRLHCVMFSMSILVSVPLSQATCAAGAVADLVLVRRMRVISTKSFSIGGLRIPQSILAQSLAMVAVLSIIVPLLFRHWGLQIPFFLWLALGAFNFPFFVAMLMGERWLREKSRSWPRATRQRVAFVLVVVALLFLSYAVVIAI